MFGTAGTTLGMLVLATMPSFQGLVLGGLLYGIGLSTMWVSATSSIQQWFTDANAKKKITVTFGVTIFWLRGASITSYYVLPLVAEEFGVPAALWTTVAVSFISFLTSVLFWLQDMHTRLFECFCARRTHLIVVNPMKSNSELRDNLMAKQNLPLRERVVKMLKEWKVFFGLLPLGFWMLVGIETTTAAACWTFGSFGTLFLSKYWGYSVSTAARVTSLVATADAVGTPLISILLVYTGKRAYYILAACVLMIASTVVYSGLLVPAEVVFACVGLVQAILDTTLFPCVPVLGK